MKQWFGEEEKEKLGHRDGTKEIQVKERMKKRIYYPFKRHLAAHCRNAKYDGLLNLKKQDNMINSTNHEI